MQDGDGAFSLAIMRLVPAVWAGGVQLCVLPVLPHLGDSSMVEGRHSALLMAASP